ncbi:MAG TPA: Asd/ArgC dimerization domain-containing protein [Terriglobales bacterium]|nr:Asd/ArgC dimerization domain-containing protein [Terriglobales bacterium]
MTPGNHSATQERAATSREVYRVAIVGAATLKGKELKEVLEDRNFPALEVKLLDDEESLGQLDSVGDEATFIQSVLPENLQGADIIFFASDSAFTRKNFSLAKKAGALVVDLSYGLESEPGAAVRAPWIERELEQTAGVRPPAQLDSTLAVVAHPAAVVLALLLLRAQKAGALCNAVCTAFEPASEHGRRGLDELHGQTVSLLSFQQLPTEVFDAQIAFNMLARYGEKSTPTLESVERRVLADLEKVAEGRTTPPAFMLAQAPIFHGHVFSLYLEFEKQIPAAELVRALAGDHVSVAGPGEDSPTNVAAAGQDEVLVDVRRDARHERALWVWAAADNLRIAALTAVDCAAALARMRSKGSVQ